MKDTLKIYIYTKKTSDRIIVRYEEGEVLLLLPFKVRGTRGGTGGGFDCSVLTIGWNSSFDPQRELSKAKVSFESNVFTSKLACRPKE